MARARFATVAVVTLALDGANSAIFALADDLLRALPFTHPQTVSS
jgi:hypothetical protein